MLLYRRNQTPGTTTRAQQLLRLPTMDGVAITAERFQHFSFYSSGGLSCHRRMRTTSNDDDYDDDDDDDSRFV